MKNIQRLLTNICSGDLNASKDFYLTLFDFEVAFDSEWFVQLVSKDKSLELGIIDRSSDLIPEDFQNPPAGFYLTFVVDDVDSIFEMAQKKDLEVVSPPTDMMYGQRRLLLKDPNGTLIDVSATIKDFQFKG